MTKRWTLLALLTSLSVITYLDRVCIGLAGSNIQADLAISPRQWGWILGVFSLSYGLFEIPTGALGDRFGQRGVLTRIVAWWSSFTILTGMASSFVVLLTTRFLFGAGEAGAYPNMSSALGRAFPIHQRARAQSAIWAASRVGGAIAPFLVIPMMAAWGWRTPFVVFGIVGLVWAGIWHQSSRSFALFRRADHDRRPHAGAPWRTFFRRRQFWLILIMAWFYGWGASFYLSWLTDFLVKDRGLDQMQMKLYTALPFLLGMVGNLTGGVLCDRLSNRFGLRIGRRAVGGSSLALAGLMLFLAASASEHWVRGVAAGIGYGIMDCMLPASWANCVDIGGPYAGSLSGAMNTSVQAGGFISIVLFGYMVEQWGSYDLPLCAIAAMTCISACFFACIDPTKPLVTPTCD